MSNVYSTKPFPSISSMFHIFLRQCGFDYSLRMMTAKTDRHGYILLQGTVLQVTRSTTFLINNNHPHWNSSSFKSLDQSLQSFENLPTTMLSRNKIKQRIKDHKFSFMRMRLLSWLSKSHANFTPNHVSWTFFSCLTSWKVSIKKNIKLWKTI